MYMEPVVGKSGGKKWARLKPIILGLQLQTKGGCIIVLNIGDTLQSKVCPTMAGTIVKLDKNRAVIRITRTRYSKDIGRELVIDTSFWDKI